MEMIGCRGLFFLRPGSDGWSRRKFAQYLCLSHTCAAVKQQAWHAIAGRILQKFAHADQHFLRACITDPPLRSNATYPFFVRQAGLLQSLQAQMGAITHPRSQQGKAAPGMVEVDEEGLVLGFRVLHPDAGFFHELKVDVAPDF